jgi:hypothetical protein
VRFEILTEETYHDCFRVGDWYKYKEGRTDGGAMWGPIGTRVSGDGYYKGR